MFLIKKKWRRKLLLPSLLLFTSLLSPLLVWAQEQVDREVVLLAINDVYRIEGVEDGRRGGISRVRALRKELEQQHPDLLFLHAGDFLFPSLLSQWTQGTHMVEMMNELDGVVGAADPRMFVVFGNHEFDKSRRKHAALLQARIDQSEFQWLGTNIKFAHEGLTPLVMSKNLLSSTIVKSGGVQVGIFGLTTNKKPAYKIAYVDEFVDPASVAEEQTAILREQGAEIVIALTHLALEKDREILEKLRDGGPDLIIGGHEHRRTHVEVDGRWILKADADARTATVVRIRMIGKKPFISFGYRFVEQGRVTPDPEVQKHVNQILAEHDDWFCMEKRESSGCLNQAVGQTAVPLNGEELEIRSYETNLGNWVADQIRAAVPDADIAFINAGSLRVNQTIPPGPITRRHLEELMHYDSELVGADLTKDQLNAVLERAAEDWVSQGHWLQISGLAFQHHPRHAEGHRINEIRLFREGKLRDLPDRPLKVVTNKYLIQGGDGYQMLRSSEWISVVPSLKKYLRLVLEESREAIQPRVDGRICNVREIGRRPCVFRNSLEQ